MQDQAMTPAALAAIEKRVAAATPGPWQVIVDKHPHRLGGDHIERRIFTTWDHGQLKGPLGVVNHATGIGVEGGPAVQFVQIDEPDAALIANAPTDLAALLAHIRRLEAEREAEIAAAVARETERCREVLDEMCAHFGAESPILYLAAAAIREPKP